MTSSDDKDSVPLRGQIITLYSYKGGVGRSMAAANLATILAQRGKRVLLMDLDVEAPGLHRYLLRSHTKTLRKRFIPPTLQRGVIELFEQISKQLDRLGREDGGQLSEEAVGEAIRQIIRHLLDDKQYYYQVQMHNPNIPETSASLYFMPAGYLAEDYPTRVREYRWQELYERDARIFPIIREELKRRYDYVLVDSRTGVSDVGSVCTVLLPDKLILVFSTNEQSLHGALEVGRQAREQRVLIDKNSPLEIFPLLSRVDIGEEKLKRRWIRLVKDSFSKFLTETSTEGKLDLGIYFDSVLAAHSSFFSYGEHIAAERERETETGSLTACFARLADCMECSSLAHAQRRLAEPDLARINVLLEDTSMPLASSMISLRKGDLLLRMNSPEDAIVIFDNIVKKFGDNPDPLVQVQVAAALFSKGLALTYRLHRHEDALTAYDELIHRFLNSTEARETTSRHLASAMVNRGSLLIRLRRFDDVLSSCDAVINTFSNSNDIYMLGQVGKASVNKILVLLHIMRKYDDVIAITDDLMRRFIRVPHPKFDQISIVRLLVARVEALQKSGQAEKALELSEQIQKEFRTNKKGEIKKDIKTLLEQTMEALLSLGRKKEAASIARRLQADRRERPVY